jgi:hypothetical protein
MPLETHIGLIEPADENAIIWRFMNLRKFQDLIATQELHFCRADQFLDQTEGLPPEGHLPSPNLHPLDIRDKREIDALMGSIAQFREAFYINCWHSFHEETCQMWKEYGDDGVAICSTYALLKSALSTLPDKAYLGLVRYGPQPNERWNLFRFVYHKRIEFKHEQEVRALLWIQDPHAGINRHFDADNRVYPFPLTPPPAPVPKGHRRKVDPQSLLTGIVVTPLASSDAFDRIAQAVKSSGLVVPVVPSGLARYKDLLPL